MTKTFDEWLGEIEEITEEHGSLSLEQLIKLLDAADSFTHIKYEYIEMDSGTLGELLDDLARRNDAEEWYEHSPCIAIKKRGHRFFAWITTDRETEEDTEEDNAT